MEVRRLGCKCSFCIFILNMKDKLHKRPHTVDTANISMEFAREIERATLMAPEEMEEERKWEEDRRRRQMETAQRQVLFEQRRKNSLVKIQELNNRWKNLEARRQKRNVEYLQRMASTVENVSGYGNDVMIQNAQRRENTTI